MAKLIAGTYSDALFELALEKNTVDSYAEEVAFLKEVFEENKELTQLLNHPKIASEEKISVIENIFKGHISDDITGFIVIIVNKNRSVNLLDIFEDFLAKVKEHNKIGIAYITSAVELNKIQKAKVEDKLLATTDYEKFEMNYEVDSSLIGGMVIRIKDRVVDNSIKTKLYMLSQNLFKIQI